jgi:hypothetical protein
VQEYVSLCFSPDGKLLLAQGSSPDWSLLLWAWEKSRLACSVRSTNLQGSPVVQVRKKQWQQHRGTWRAQLVAGRACWA